MKTHLFHLVIAFLVACAAFAGYAVWYAAVAAASASVADLEQQINMRSTTIDRIAAAQSALAGISGNAAAMQGYFVSESDVVSFISALEAIGAKQKSKVSVTSVSKGGAGAQSTLAFSLAATGTFSSVVRTVGAIEYLPYDILVTDLSLTQNEKDWAANIRLSVGSASTTTTSTKP